MDRIEALTRGNLIRLQRASIRAQIEDGEATVVEVLETLPYCMEGIQLGNLLKFQRGIGLFRARKLCRHLGIDQHRKVGSLSWREREIVIRELS